MRFGAFDIWGVSGALKFLSISVTLGFCERYICGLHDPSPWTAQILTVPPICMGKRSCCRSPPYPSEILPWDLLPRAS